MPTETICNVCLESIRKGHKEDHQIGCQFGYPERESCRPCATGKGRHTDKCRAKQREWAAFKSQGVQQ